MTFIRSECLKSDSRIRTLLSRIFLIADNSWPRSAYRVYFGNMAVQKGERMYRSFKRVLQGAVLSLQPFEVAVVQNK